MVPVVQMNPILQIRPKKVLMPIEGEGKSVRKRKKNTRRRRRIRKRPKENVLLL
jgi:hypothetical protein